MEKETIIQIIMFCVFFILVVWVIFATLNNMEEQMIVACHKHNWEGMITGEVEINCTGLWEREYANGKWAERCRAMEFNPLSPKPSCHLLCNIDCELQNKQAGELICVC